MTIKLGMIFLSRKKWRTRRDCHIHYTVAKSLW